MPEHVVLAIPTHRGEVAIECLVSVFQLQDHVRVHCPEMRLSLSWQVGSPTEVARNVLTARFLADPTATHLLFVDDDMGFAPSLIRRLLDEDQPVTSAFYPSRVVDPARVQRAAASGTDAAKLFGVAASYPGAANIVHENGSFDLSASGFVRATATGTGIMLIRRDALVRIGTQDPSLWRPPYFPRYVPFRLTSPVLECFNPIEEGGVLLSEDISFCRRWAACGGVIWACATEEVSHVGRIVVTGRFRDYLDHHGGISAGSGAWP